jgi:hypothetical protein
MLTDSSSATCIDKKNKPAADAPNKPTASVATSAATLCPRCKYQFANELSDVNLLQHQNGSKCRKKASTLQSASDAPSSSLSVLPASATEVQPSDAQKAKKRRDKQRWKANAAEREAEEKDAKKLRDQAEKDRLKAEQARRLAEKQHAAERDPKLLEEICEANKECNDPTCPKLHQCTRIGKRWECGNFLCGSPSNSTKPGHSRRQLQCNHCTELLRNINQRHWTTLSKDEKKKKGASRKRPRDGEPIGTANPLERMEAEWKSLEQMIGNHPDWTMLRDANSNGRVIDVEFASAPSDLVEGSTVLFQICVIGYESKKIIMNELVNFVPPDYPGNPLDYLRMVLPNNVDRAMASLLRVHELEKGNE